MFVSFFYLLRKYGIPVSLTEWLSLQTALAKGMEHASLSRFYYLCRSLCVKKESQFDLYDQIFAHYFRDVEFSKKFHEELEAWLKEPIMPRALSDEERRSLEELDLDKLRDMFEQRLHEQRGRHDGGNKWIGTGGTSPFGHGGYHPSGLRMGGPGKHRSAMQVAERRRFANLRQDQTLDTRGISQALRKLRVLGREGSAEELDLEETINATAKNAGDITMVFQPERKNAVKLMLLMDVGGSMTPYTHLSEKLFSAAHQANHFKAFRHFYFHNTPYESLYENIELEEKVATIDVLKQLDSSWFILIVGDAAMSPYELTVPGGSVDYFHHNEEPGLVWLQRIREVSSKSVWFNPEPQPYWERTSTRIIRQVFPMFSLSIDGIGQGMEHLLK